MTETVTSHLLKATSLLPLYRQEGAEEGSGEGGLLFFEVALVFSLCCFCFEYYLDLRQHINYMTITEVPALLRGKVTGEVFLKSQKYNRDKSSFNLVEKLLHVKGMALLCLGFMPFLWDWSVTIMHTYCSGGVISYLSVWTGPVAEEAFVACIFVSLLMCYDVAVSIPFSLYRTFGIEQKHGFNKITLGLYLQDMAMQMLLAITIAVPVVSGIVALIRHGGKYFYLYVWALLFAVSVFLLTIYPEYIAPTFNQYARLPGDSDEYKKITLLAKRVHFPLTNIYVMDGSKRSAHSNAFFYGFFNNKRIVLYDTLMKQVDMDELLAILGHEIGHWSLGHTLQGFAITQVWVFLTFFCFAQFGGIRGFVADFGFSPHDTPVLIRLLLFMQVFFEPVDKTLTFFMNVLSRHNEFAADAYAKGLGMGRELGTGLVKISKENLSNMVPDKLYSAYHFSHPPVVERLAELKPFTVQGVVMKGDTSTPSKGNVARDIGAAGPSGGGGWLRWIRTAEGLEEVQMLGVGHTVLLFVAVYLNYVFSAPFAWLIKLGGWVIILVQSIVLVWQLWIATAAEAAHNSKSE